jgi:hypothetical protein
MSLKSLAVTSGRTRTPRPKLRYLHSELTTDIITNSKGAEVFLKSADWDIREHNGLCRLASFSF